MPESLSLSLPLSLGRTLANTQEPAIHNHISTHSRQFPISLSHKCLYRCFLDLKHLSLPLHAQVPIGSVPIILKSQHCILHGLDRMPLRTQYTQEPTIPPIHTYTSTLNLSISLLRCPSGLCPLCSSRSTAFCTGWTRTLSWSWVSARTTKAATSSSTAQKRYVCARFRIYMPVYG